MNINSCLTLATIRLLLDRNQRQFLHAVQQRLEQERQLEDRG
ncbi:hypothetical protein HMPREF1574_00759, partial [Gardnerella pickettii JCP7659]